MKRHLVSGPFFSLDIVPDYNSNDGDDGNDGDDNDDEDENDVDQCGDRANLFNIWGGDFEVLYGELFDDKDDGNDSFAVLWYEHKGEHYKYFDG